MNDDSFLNLLNEADRAVERPLLQPDVQGRVIRRAQRQKSVRRTAALVVVLMAVIPLTLLRHPAVPIKQLSLITKIPTPQAVTSPQADALDAMVAQKTADAIVKLRRQQTAIALPALDPALKIQLDQDATAATLLAAGDHFSRDPAHVRQGADDYHRVQTFFPGTPWAAAASERLKQLHS